MLTREDDVEIHALARRGWSKSALASGPQQAASPPHRRQRPERDPRHPQYWPPRRFSTTYRLNPGYGVVRFWFMVSTLTEADYV
jgi:hypothetical protein